MQRFDEKTIFVSASGEMVENEQEHYIKVKRKDIETKIDYSRGLVIYQGSSGRSVNIIDYLNEKNKAIEYGKYYLSETG